MSLIIRSFQLCIINAAGPNRVALCGERKKKAAPKDGLEVLGEDA